ncbi:hypothetical protein BD408DRAFT_434940 [Parasitella parasitica]|nr:hypothetical protein BD408DRAFT_434940 [Parasitella parasitica]
MSLFKSKRNNQITSEFDTTTQPGLLPIQNVYSAYNRLPSPVFTVDQSAENLYRSSSIRNNNNHHHQKPNQNNEHASLEKFSQQQMLIKEAEERAAMYYPTTFNKTTVGIGEISDLTLRPHAVTNITFPILFFSDASNNFINPDRNTTADPKERNGSAFETLVDQLCYKGGRGTENDDAEQKEIEIVYDLMPTLRFGDNGALSMLFAGQTTTVSCEKLQNITKQP